MKKIIPFFLLALLFYFSAPSIAKESFKNLALEASGADYNKAAEINNDGIRHFSGRHWSESAEFFEKALKIDPNLAEAHFNLALFLHKKNRHKEATDHFRKAAKLAPDDQRIQNSDLLKKHVNGKGAMEMTHGNSKTHDPAMKGDEHTH